ncbi:hypothetical protein PG991_016053 [Apiospora marii]|uniref:Uncharacterized protein n=1 Tax=Apiospora marii TaxID=335849 RepID=A0ABR1R0K7_9PEZI
MGVRFGKGNQPYVFLLQSGCSKWLDSKARGRMRKLMVDWDTESKAVVGGKIGALSYYLHRHMLIEHLGGQARERVRHSLLRHPPVFYQRRNVLGLSSRCLNLTIVPKLDSLILHSEPSSSPLAYCEVRRANVDLHFASRRVLIDPGDLIGWDLVSAIGEGARPSLVREPQLGSAVAGRGQVERRSVIAAGCPWNRGEDLVARHIGMACGGTRIFREAKEQVCTTLRY